METWPPMFTVDACVYNFNMDESKLSHLDSTGRAKMVDVGHKPETERSAVAQGT